MAVLCEAISVVVRTAALNERFSGGREAFLAVVPNATYCGDGELERVGFMSPDDVGDFIALLEQRGLRFLDAGDEAKGALDLAVVDQQRGPTTAVTWLGFTRMTLDAFQKDVSTAWLYQGDQPGYGAPVPEGGLDVYVPDGWTYEGSMSESVNFVPTEEVESRLKYLREEGGLQVYLDRETGKELFLGRPRIGVEGPARP